MTPPFTTLARDRVTPPVLTFFFTVLLAGAPLLQAADQVAARISVRDFGAIPDDGKDDRPGILAALEKDRETGAKAIVFEAGVYDIISFDGEPGASSRKWIEIAGLKNCAISGAVDAGGKPATRLIRHHEGINFDPLGRFLHLMQCANVKVENLFLAHDPCFFSQGTVVAKDGQSVTVEVWPGYRRADGMAAWTVVRCDAGTREVLDDSRGKNGFWKAIDGGNGRLMRLENPRVAERCDVGQHLAWFQDGREMPMIDVADSTDIALENLWLRDPNGFGLWATGSRNVTARKVWIRPEGDEPPARREGTLAAIDYVLSRVLRLLHPFAPFVTEELWRGLGLGAATIQFAPWPTPADRAAFEPEARWAEAFFSAISRARNLRAEYNVPSNKKLRWLWKPANPAGQAETPVLATLLNASEIALLDGDPPKATPVCVTDIGLLALPLEGILDPGAERARLEKELAKADRDLETTRAKLANPQFTEKVPPAVLAEHQEREASLAARCGQLRQRLAAL